MKPPIIYRFAVLSLLCVVALALIMGFALSSLLTRAVLEYEWQNTAAFARREVQQAGLDAFFTAPRSPEARERWGKELPRLLTSLPEVVRVKVWDRGGTVLWSDEARLIGQRFPDNHERQTALAGKVTAEIRELTGPEHAYERGGSTTLAEVYVPIFSKGSGEVLGVLELYRTTDRVFATIRWGRIVIWTISLTGGLILYLALLPLVRQVYGREVHEETLLAYAGKLEHEVTERTRELQSKTERLTRLAALAQTVTASLDIQRVFEAVVEGARQMLHVTLVRLWVVEPSTEEIVLAATACAPDQPVNLEGAVTPAAKGQGIAGWVIERRRPRYSPVLAEDPMLMRVEWVKREALVSQLAVPLLQGDRALGALVVITRERREFSPEEQELLETLAAEAALAIENARLYRRAEERAQKLTALSTLTQLITSTPDRREVFNAVAKAATVLLGAKLAHVSVDDPAGRVLRVQGRFGLDPKFEQAMADFPVFPYGQGVVGSVFSSRAPEYLLDIQQDPRLLNRRLAKEAGLHAFAGLPLIARDRVVGVLAILFSDRRQFAPEEKELISLLADQAAVAIENARLHEETQQQLRQTETLLAATQAIGSTLDLTEVLRRMTREMVRALGADMGGAWLLTPNRDGLLPVAGYHVPKELLQTFSGTPFPLEHSLIEHVKQLQGHVYSSDSQADPRFDHPLFRLVPHKSVLCVPMRVKDKVFGGVVIAWVREPHHFTPDELRLAEAIAWHAAVAMENARLWESEREAREQLEMSETRYRGLFENAIDIVYLHDLEGRILAVNEAGVRASGYAREELIGMNLAQLMAPEDRARNTDLIRRMIRGERISEFFTAQFIRKDGTRAILESSGRVVFKDGAPVAVEGVARDITVRRMFEERQAAFVEIVKDLATEDDFGRLFSLIGRRCCELIGADSAVISLVEGDEIVFGGAYGFDEAQRVAQRKKIAESRIGQVVLTQKPHASSDMATDPHWRDSFVVTKFGCRAALEVPIIFRDEVIGVLGVLHKSPRTFSAEDEALLVSLASHMAVAIDRTNLIRELKARLLETQTLLTISQAVSSTRDPTEMMRRVARETARALGADMVGAYRVDPDQESLRPIAGYHVPKQFLEAFMNLPIPLKGHRFLEEAWWGQQPVWSSDAEADPRIDRETFERFPHRSVLFVPMIVKGEPIGGLFAIWWDQSHHLTPQEIRLVEAIGSQSAIAIENARLFEETQHRLHEMTGLHQIAQSISTLTDIRETYGRLTRQVADLIGARRSLIALYDSEQKQLVGQRPGYSVSEDLIRDIQTAKVGKAAAQFGNLRKLGSLILNNPRDLPPALQEFVNRHQLQSIAAVPLSIEGKVIGILYAADKPGGFAESDARLLEVFASQAAIVIRNAHLYQQLTEAYEALKTSQAQLIQAEKLAATGQLAAGVAHEINNPLSVILGFSSLALEKHPSKDLADDLETIRAQALRAAKIIRDLLIFARPTPHERHPVDLNEVLRQTLGLQAYHLATEQIEVAWKLTEPLPKTLADRSQLQQVVLNLVLNAHQAMKTAHGRGTLCIETGSDGAHVWAKIRDDGPGIAPELLPRIFDPFLTTKPVGQGTGLGLSISYGIAQAHGGHLLAESEPGHGATFTIVLPVIESEARATAEPLEPVAAPAQQLSVLVVDDEPTVARVLSLMFEQLGHRAEVAHSGREALIMLARGTYDLMTLDLRMPHMSGQEFWKSFETANLPRRPKVLFVTGDIATKGAKAFLAQSGQPYLVKPFQPRDLWRKINELGL